jgi:hypothetical protein
MGTLGWKPRLQFASVDEFYEKANYRKLREYFADPLAADHKVPNGVAFQRIDTTPWQCGQKGALEKCG